MSFILDALKKSESERQRQAGPALLEMRIVRPTRRLPVWALIVGALLIISVAALAWVVLKPSAAPATAQAGAAPPTGPIAPNTVPASAPAATAVAPTPSAAGPGTQAATAAVPMQTAPPVGAVQQSVANPADNPADTEPAVTQAPMMRQEPSGPNTANLHTYAELGGSLPELRLDLHVYAQNPAERYAFINMHKMHEGDTTPEGVQVKEITPTGVVMEYRGTEFLLGRQ